jgi:hypothetical protein
MAPRLRHPLLFPPTPPSSYYLLHGTSNSLDVEEAAMASSVFFHNGLGVVRRGPGDGARGPPPQGGGGGLGDGRGWVSEQTSVTASTTDSTTVSVEADECDMEEALCVVAEEL